MYKHSAALDADVLKELERTELHREAAQLLAVVENQRLEIGRMAWDIIGQPVDADASEVEFSKLNRSWGNNKST
jgi:hypothetical protein